ncbi:MAG: hypothetical protein U5R48_14200 [Gammaproteobacteria bacterium]|nr:hypothetical protein [Gammaproteobacteria bacterium]
MLIDVSELEAGSGVEAEVCIVGAGAAGITLARSFSRTPTRVVLLESGGADFERNVQALADWDNTGLPYYPLADARLRFFGRHDRHLGRTLGADGCHRFSPARLGAPQRLATRGRNRRPPVSGRPASIGAAGNSARTGALGRLSVEPPPFDPRRISTAIWQIDQPPGRFALRRTVTI